MSLETGEVMPDQQTIEPAAEAALGGLNDAPVADSSGELKITAKEAADLVRAQTPAALLQLLKKPDHSDAARRVFAGYRVNGDNLKTPLARGRLVSELVTNSKLLDAVLALPHAPDAPRAASPAKAVPKPAPPSVKSDGAPDAEGSARAQLFAGERDALRQELRELRNQLHAAQAEEEGARRALQGAQAEVGVARAKLNAEQAANAWRERRLRRLERELADARSVAEASAGHPQPKANGTSAAPSSPAKSNGSASVDGSLSETLFTALDRLLSRGKIEPARLLADEMLHGDPHNIEALRIRALARLAQHNRPGALVDMRLVFETHIARHEPLQAARAMLRWMDVAGAADAKMAQSLYVAASRESAGVIADLRDALLAVQDNAPEQYDLLRSWCQPGLADILFVSGADQVKTEHLPAQFLQLTAQNVNGRMLAARDVIAAIDTASSAIVDAAREAFAKLDKRGQEQTLLAITEAAQGDRSYGRLLARRTLAGPAIIDASNVAHFERELMPSARPLLSNIMAVRRALRERGYFPVQIIADANLPHVIDLPDALWNMVRRGEAELVTGGTVADDAIVREARRLDAAIVSNDYMAEWDPAGELMKIQYSVSLTDGRASLYD